MSSSLSSKGSQSYKGLGFCVVGVLTTSGVVGVLVTGVPQLLQNEVLAYNGLPQLLHVNCAWPQILQNLAPSGKGLPQC